MRAQRRYLAWLGGTFAALLVAAALLSLWVDPYRMFRIPGHLDDKFARPRASQQVWLVKSYGIAHARPVTLVLGNSRAEIGFDPESPMWPADWRPVYNAGIPGSGIRASVDMLSRALQAGDVRHIVVGLEFLDFLTDDGAASASSTDQASDRWFRSPTWRAAQRVLSLDSTLDSLATLAALHDPSAADITVTGFNPLHEYPLYARREGYAALFQQRESEVARALSRLSATAMRPGMTTSDSWAQLDRLLALAERHHVDVKLLVYPYHARMLELFHRAGLWPAFEAWKIEITKVVRARPELLGHGCALWDFSGYHAFAREPVPPRGDLRSEVPSYWEAGHFKSSLGNRMLDRMLHDSGAGASDFGRCLVDADVPAVLRSIAAQRQAYLAATSGLAPLHKAP